jgi:type VI secretion system protein ImpH
VPIVRNYVGDEFSWDVNLILLKEEVPALRLGAAGRLGWTTWLGTRRSARNAADLILNPYVNAA